MQLDLSFETADDCYHSLSLLFWATAKNVGVGRLLALPADEIISLVERETGIAAQPRWGAVWRNQFEELCRTREEHNFAGVVFNDDGECFAKMHSPEMTGRDACYYATILKRLRADGDVAAGYDVREPAQFRLPRVGRLYLRSPLPPALLLDESDGVSRATFCIVRDAVTALGFEKTLVFHRMGTMRLQSGPTFALGVLHIPTADAGNLWHELVPQACCFQKSMEVHASTGEGFELVTQPRGWFKKLFG